MPETALCGAAHPQPVDAPGGPPDAHRDAPALLAARADARIELHVVADHHDPGERVGAVADDGGALHRVLDLAVLDPERLARGEHELAARDVDLAAAEVRGIEAALEARDDFLA